MNENYEYDYDNIEEKSAYWALVKIAGLVTRIKYKYKCVGAENIPSDGKLIIAANHVSAFDPAFVVMRCKRQCHYMSKTELFDNMLLAKIMNCMNAFPIDRQKLDRKAIYHAEKVLADDKVLGIFPEGTRSPTGLPIKPKSGIGMIALNSKADILPAAIYIDINDKSKRKKITLRYGKVIKFDEIQFESEKKSAQMKQITEMVMDNIIALREEKHCK